MPTVSAIREVLPLVELLEPTTIEDLREAVKTAIARGLAIYPIGGGTSLDFGLTPHREGIGISLAGLSRVVDYPASDMTITVEAGITMDSLRRTLGTNGQHLPIDVPRAGQATLGGVVATNPIGPRCFGAGTVRDYVIGIEAVDSQGNSFKAGGRVVKNVAGYDFCKLLTGSLGTLGIITQLTFKLKPTPQRSSLMTCSVANLNEAEHRLAAMVNSETTPTAIELLVGDTWRRDSSFVELADESDEACLLVVGLEGTHQDVEWMKDQLRSEWKSQGATQIHTVPDDGSQKLWNRFAEFPAETTEPLVLQAHVLPSKATQIIKAIQRVDPNCDILAHAGNGVVIARLTQFPADGFSRVLTNQLQPLALSAHGNIIILSSPGDIGMTRQTVWGGLDAPFGLMSAIKKQFDPEDRLNPGRFVYQ